MEAVTISNKYLTFDFGGKTLTGDVTVSSGSLTIGGRMLSVTSGSVTATFTDAGLTTITGSDAKDDFDNVTINAGKGSDEIANNGDYANITTNAAIINNGDHCTIDNSQSWSATAKTLTGKVLNVGGNTITPKGATIGDMSINITSEAINLSGTGTEDDPYKISTTEDLHRLASGDGVYFQLTDDITIEGGITVDGGSLDLNGHKVICADGCTTAFTVTGDFTLTDSVGTGGIVPAEDSAGGAIGVSVEGGNFTMQGGTI